MGAVKSMTDVAYEVLSKKKRSIPFNKLWEEVNNICGVGMDQIGQFYSDLILDNRFVSLKENKWDLRERRRFEETHIDISKIALDDDEDEPIIDDVGIVSNTDEY